MQFDSDFNRQEEQRRKKGGYVPRPKIELGAVLNTTCRKCGTVGGSQVNDFIASTINIA